MLEAKTISVTSPATASTAIATSEFAGLDHFDHLMIVADLVGATGGTLDVYLQAYDGTSWYDYLHFAQLAAGAAAIVKAIPIARAYQRTAPVTVGRGTPALVADTCIGGDFGDRFRIVMVAGASTSAGAAISIRVVGTKLTR